jgi:hypothetical protein
MSEVCASEVFGGQLLAAHDFDGTIAITSEPSPNGMTVELAYDLAVQQIFDYNALGPYRAAGGMKNRAPTEIVTDIYKERGLTKSLEAIHATTEDLVAVKLDYLNAEVGQRLTDGTLWPRLTAGFVPYWDAIQQNGSITSGVLSSGHENIIRRILDVNNLLPPDIFATDDDMRPVTPFLPRDLLEKPSPFLMQVLHSRWLHHIEATEPKDTYHSSLYAVAASNTLYIGDDVKKDGELAANSGVDFIHIDPLNAAPSWRVI